MHRLKLVEKENDIPEQYRNTPVSDLILYHNADMAHKNYEKAELLIGMCMDNRKMLSIPEKFAFIIRAGGANLRYSEFKVSFAIAMAGVEYIALIGHTQCGMVNLASKKEQFIKGLCDHGGWTPEKAEEQFVQFSPMFEIGNEVDFILSEANRLAARYPKVTVVPLIYKVEDNHLYWIDSKA